MILDNYYFITFETHNYLIIKMSNAFKKIIKIVISAILVTSLVYFNNYRESNTKDNVRNRRNLASTLSYYNSKCINSNSTSIIGGEIVLRADATLSDYLKNFTFIKSDQTRNIHDAIISDNDQTRDDALMSIVKNVLAPYIIFIIFAIVTIIAWIVCCGCCCCPCCCCKNTTGEEPICGCQKISVVITFIAVLGVVIVCIIGFIFASKSNDKLLATECSAMRLYLDLFEGQNTTVIPKWVGVVGIDNKLGELVNAVDVIEEKSSTAFDNDISNTKQEAEDYNALLDTSWETYKDKYTSNPNPSSTVSSYIPGFISKYGPRTSESTLKSLSDEFETTLVIASEVILNIKNVTDYITKDISSSKKIFQDAKDGIQPLKNDFGKIDTDYIQKYTDFKETNATELNYAFIGIFIVILVIDILFIIFLVFFGCCNVNCMKYPAHFFWNIISLITIALFLLSSAFGLAGTAFLYVGPLVQVMFSTDGMHKIFGQESDATKIINSCMNGDGNLKPIIIGDSSLTTVMDTFYNYSNTLQEVANSVTGAEKSSPVNTLYTNLYTQLITDIGFDTTSSNDSPLLALQKFTALTDNNYPDSLQSSCTSNTYDFWYSQYNSCPSGYATLTTSSTTEMIGKASCLKIREWTESRVRERYASQPSCKDINFIDQAASYSKSLNKYGDDSEVLLKGLLDEMKTFDNKYRETSSGIKEAITSVQSITTPMIDILNDTVGKNSLFDLINCHFLSDNAAVIVIAFENAGTNFVQISACLAALSFLNWILVFCGLIYILRKVTMLKIAPNPMKAADNKVVFNK